MTQITSDITAAQQRSGAEAGIVRARLQAAWRTARRADHAHGIAMAALTATLAAWAMLIVDWALEPDWAFRLAIAGAAAVAVVAVVWRYWLVRLERFDPLNWALRVEAARPQWRSLLVSSVQMHETTSRNESPALIAAVHDEAARATEGVQLGSLVEAGPRRGTFAAAAVAALLVLLGALGMGDYFAVLGDRLVSPTDAAGYPALTQIEMASGDRVVRRGEALTVEATARGLMPGTAELQLRAGSGDWQTIVLQRGPGQRYAHRFAQVVQGFEYRFVIGGATSAVYQVRVAAAPRVVETRIELSYPDYMERPDETRRQLSLSVPRGTTLRWTLGFDRPVREAELLRVEAAGSGNGSVDDGAAGGRDDGAGDRLNDRPGEAEMSRLTEATIGEDGMNMTATWRADRSTRYALRVVDAAYGMTHRRAIVHRIDVIDDAPPSVQLLGREEGRSFATAAKQLDLRFRASDDHGIAAVRLAYAVNDGPTQHTAELRVGDKRIVECRIRKALGDLDEGIGRGDVVRLTLEARDVRPEGRAVGVGRSAALWLEIVEPAEYQRRVYDQLDGVLQRIEAVRAAGANAAAALRSLHAEASGNAGDADGTEPMNDRDDEGKGEDRDVGDVDRGDGLNGAGPGGVDSIVMAEIVADRRQELAAIQRRMEGLTEQLRAIVGDLRANRMYREAGGGRVEQMARLMERASNRHVATALAALGRASEPAGDGLGAIARAAGQVEAAVGVLDRLLEQGGQRHRRTRLAMEARRLAEAQWRLRERLSEWARGVIAGQPLTDEEVDWLATQQRELLNAMRTLNTRLTDVARGAEERALKRARQEIEIDPPTVWAERALTSIEAGRPVPAAESADRAMRAVASVAAMLWEGLTAAEQSAIELAGKATAKLQRDQRRLRERLERAVAAAAGDGAVEGTPPAEQDRVDEAIRAAGRRAGAEQADLARAAATVLEQVAGLPSPGPADAMGEAVAAMRRSAERLAGETIEVEAALAAQRDAEAALGRTLDRLAAAGGTGSRGAGTVGNGNGAGGSDSPDGDGAGSAADGGTDSEGGTTADNGVADGTNSGGPRGLGPVPDWRSPEGAGWSDGYAAYLDTLPSEYRALLEDYYEVLSE